MAKASVNFGAGFHVAAGQHVDRSAYDRYTGDWSRLFVPAVLAAAEVAAADRILDVATGPGEAASLALAQLGPAGLVVGRHLAGDARRRTYQVRRCEIPTSRGRWSSAAIRPRRRAAVCVISIPERVPMWGALAEILSRYLPDQREVLHLMFSLVDAGHLERLLASAGFREISVTRETRERSFASVDDYWAPIEEAPGTGPQAYRALPDASRQAVREEMYERLASFESNGRLIIRAEMLIGAGRA